MTRSAVLSKAIADAARHPKARADAPLSAFLGVTGQEYDQQLMIVGRAVNGWDEWSPVEITSGVTKPEDVVESLSNGHGRCPLAWVCEIGANGYNAGRSAFWRTARGVQEAIAPRKAKGCWASRLAWSNLYKLSGSEGNPPAWLANSQFEACQEILGLEIRNFAPRRVLFLTGWGWAKWFVPAIAEGDAVTVTEHEPLQAHGRLATGGHSCAFAVIPHPQGKPETELVRAALNGFQAAGTM